MPEQEWIPLSDTEQDVPVACLGCGTLSREAAGFDVDGDPVCPECESVDVLMVDLAEGLEIVEATG